MARLVKTGLTMLAWVACVVGVATVSWLAIDSAGRRVGAVGFPDEGGSASVVTTSQGAVSASTPVVTSSVPVPASGRSEGRADTGRESVQWSGSVWDGIRTGGGAVGLECAGTVISDYRVQPNTGWTAYAEKVSPSLLKATFRHDDRRIEIDGSCVTWVPILRLDVHITHD